MSYTIKLCLFIFVFGSTFSAPLHAIQSPYAGEQNRVISALSPKQIQGLLAGRGLGYAKVAELNSFPGPMHVLELAEQLELTDNQLQQTQALMEEVKAEFRQLGKDLIDAETKLESMFKSGEVREQDVIEQLKAIAMIEARLRGAHILAHVKQKDMLTPSQIQKYDVLRGYISQDKH